MKIKILLALLALNSAALASPPPPTYVPSANLLGWWPLDNIWTVNDISGNNNNGAFGGVTPTNTLDRFGNPTGAYHFYGNGNSSTGGYIRIPSTAALSNMQDITISMWVRVDPQGTSAGFVTKWFTSVTNNTAVACNVANSRDAYGVGRLGNNLSYGNSGNVNGNLSGNVLNSAASPGIYQHIVYQVKSGAFEKVYINNLLVANNANTAYKICVSNNDIFFGANNYLGTPDRFYGGDLDDIGIWDRILDTCEIHALYTTTACSTTTGTVPPSGGCCLGNICGATLNALSNSYQIPLNGLNFNYTTPQTTKAQVLIGYPNCLSSSARLDVSDDIFGKSIRGFSSTLAKNNIGIHGLGFIQNTNNSGLTTIGILGENNKVGRSNGAGVAGFCAGPAVLAALPTGLDIAVYGNARINGGTYAGYFDGDVLITGNGWINSNSIITSDKKFKTNIEELKNVSEKIKNLKGYTYIFKTEEYKTKNFPSTEQIGFIAQEIKEVFPQLVIENKEGYLGVNYLGFIPVLLQATKEQQNQIEKQQLQINELKSLLNSLAGNSPGNRSGMSPVPVILNNENSVILNQNVPNPFAESTVITYNVPSDFSKAQIIFTTDDGKIIKTIDITVKGAGSLNVFANDLSHGMYSYSLIIDGKTVDTKKMIKE